MALATNLGFPRIGKKRELKKLVESYWAGKISEQDLSTGSAQIRKEHWLLQKSKGIHHIPSNDFSLYDHVLDAAIMAGAVPRRYFWQGTPIDTKTYFAMARGAKGSATAMEMTKWFDTNYHYTVPEFEEGQEFLYSDRKALREFKEAKELGVHTRPVLLGPVSFLRLGKSKTAGFDPIQLIDSLLPIYEEVLGDLHRAGADWVQIDEPCLSIKLDTQAQLAMHLAYVQLAKSLPSLKILVASYFGGLKENVPLAMKLPVAAFHIDCVRGSDDLLPILPESPSPCLFPWAS